MNKTFAWHFRALHRPRPHEQALAAKLALAKLAAVAVPKAVPPLPDLGGPLHFAIMDGQPVVYTLTPARGPFAGQPHHARQIAPCGGGWGVVNAADVGMNARLLDAAAFHERWQPEDRP